MKLVSLVFVPMLVLGACTSDPAATTLGSEDAATRSTRTVERPPLDQTPEADELRLVVEGDGEALGWLPTSRPSTVTPALNRGPLVEVRWTDNSTGSRIDPGDPNAVNRIRFFGECDAACELRLTNEVRQTIQTAPTPVIRLAACPNCSNIEKLSVFEPDGESIRGLVPSELFAALAPIDSVEELTFLFEDPTFARKTEDAWEVITAVYADPHCLPVDTRYIMWSIDAAGTRTQIAHFDLVVDEESEKISCA